MRQFSLFLHRNEALAAARVGVLGAAELEALCAGRPFSYVARDFWGSVGAWDGAILHLVRKLPEGAPP